MEDVARVVELWTGVPANKIQQNDIKRLTTLEDELKSKVIGQDHAVKLVAEAIKRNRAQLSKRAVQHRLFLLVQLVWEKQSW